MDRKKPDQPSIRSFFRPRQPDPTTLPGSKSMPPSTTIELQPTAPVPPAPAPQPTTQAQTPPDSRPFPTLPVLPPPPSLPTQASIVPVLEHHIPALRRINSLLLPVNYPETFYARILDPAVSGLFSRVILWQDVPASEPKVVGGLVCRLEPSPFVDADGNPQSLATSGRRPAPSREGSTPVNAPIAGAGPHAVYIQSLALLSPYRSLGLAAAALENVAGSAAILRQTPAGPGLPPSVNVQTIYAHVWTENEDGLRWYEARGFGREGSAPVGGYYFRLRPDTAWVVRREIGAAATGAGAGSVSSQLTAPSSRAPTSPPASIVAAAVNLPTAPRPPPSTAQAQIQVPTPPATTPSPVPSLSFQNARPEREWNDLPADMMGAGPPARSSQTHLSTPGSGASSRSSSSAARKKRDRAYPAAAFGS